MKKHNKKIESKDNQIVNNINPPKKIKIKSSNKYSNFNNSTKKNLKKIEKNDFEQKVNDFNLSNNKILPKEIIKIDKTFK